MSKSMGLGLLSKKMGFSFQVAIILGILAGANIAAATSVTNTFYGIVVASDMYGDQTTLDTSNYFKAAGENVLGKSFTLAFTTNVAAGTQYAVGGTYYYGTDPITAILTINGQSTAKFGNSGDGYYYGGPSEYSLQAFSYSNQLQTIGVVADINIIKNLPDSDSLTTKLPALQLSNNDFTDNYATFYNSSGESITLEVLSVNAQPVAAPVPEPGTMMLLGAGSLGLVIFGKRRKNV